MHVSLEKEFKFKIKIVLLKFYSILISVLTGVQTGNIQSEQTCSFRKKDDEKLNVIMRAGELLLSRIWLFPPLWQGHLNYGRLDMRLKHLICGVIGYKVQLLSNDEN